MLDGDDETAGQHGRHRADEESDRQEA